MATPAELQAKLERELLALSALRKKLAAQPPGPQRDALLEQERILQDAEITTTRAIEIASGDPARNTAIAVFDGMDENSGEFRYRNLVTGDTFLSQTQPTDGQIRRRRAPNLPPPAVVPPLPTETRPETAPAAVQTPATPPPLVEIVEPASVAEPAQVAALTNDQIAVVNPAPVDETGDQRLLSPEESIALAQRADVPVDDPVAAAADFNANTNASVLKAVAPPAPVEAGPSSGYYTASTAVQNKANELNFSRDAAFDAAQVEQLKREAAVAAEFQSPANGDWRVRLRLAPGATYLYKDKDVATSILAPLATSNGVVFPYMPSITTSYNANYDQTDLTHSNYRGQFYKSSYVGDIQISGEFTAQDTAEANYLLAVIHFFRSVTKMFYGAKDDFRGTPPPLVYLIGLGQYQFNNQPCVVKSFNYNMPNNCDYIRTKPNNYNVNLGDRQTKTATGGSNPFTAVLDRLRNAALSKGALPNVPSQTLLDLQSINMIDNSTYVPTRCDISLTLMPIQTRNQQSTLFNMKEYASGQLLKGGFW